MAFKVKSNWKKKIGKEGYGKKRYWENRQGDVLEIKTVQDRDGKNAFLYSAVETNRSSIGTSYGKTKTIAKGRNEGLVLTKAKSYMGVK